MSSKANHPYHLVDPSPWPLVGSISALVLAVGSIMYMHELDKGIVLTIGFNNVVRNYGCMVERCYKRR